tara:strand:+ start:1318 stop:1491 length:174 start_codon:yes stop_codon:yes gene_type:complete
MDIDNLEEKKEVPTSGLLAPRKQPMNQQSDAVNQPAYRVAQHMRVLRKQREMLKNGD